MAAAAGAGVALIVVRLTNGQQQHGIDRTIEVAALGELMASVSDLEWYVRYKMPKEPLDFDSGMHILPMRAAVARLKMARAESREVAKLIELWPDRIHNLVIHYQIALSRELKHSEEVLAEITSISTGIPIALPLAVSKPEGLNPAGEILIKGISGRIGKAMSTFDKKLSEQHPEAPRSSKVPQAHPVRRPGVLQRCTRRGRALLAALRRCRPS